MRPGSEGCSASRTVTACSKSPTFPSSRSVRARFSPKVFQKMTDRARPGGRQALRERSHMDGSPSDTSTAQDRALLSFIGLLRSTAHASRDGS